MAYPRHEWPLLSEFSGQTKEVEHNAGRWTQQSRVKYRSREQCLGGALSRLTSKPLVCTLHHPFEPPLSDLYERHTRIIYVSISAHQASLLPKISTRIIHHGIDTKQYCFSDKEPYLCFLGRICPIKGTHNAIEIAKRANMPLKTETTLVQVPPTRAIPEYIQSGRCTQLS